MRHAAPTQLLFCVLFTTMPWRTHRVCVWTVQDGVVLSRGCQVSMSVVCVILLSLYLLEFSVFAPFICHDHPLFPC